MVEHYNPKDIFAVVMDAKTGEILAFSQRPTFNPETGKDFGKKWANDLYQNTYEPGSTFKSYGLAAAIQEGKFKPNENMNLDIEILWVHVSQTGIKQDGAKSLKH